MNMLSYKELPSTCLEQEAFIRFVFCHIFITASADSQT